VEKTLNYFPGNKIKTISHLIFQQINNFIVQKNISWEINLNQFIKNEKDLLAIN